MVEAEQSSQINRRRSKTAGGTRESIVAAAANIFGERGYAASSIDDVAHAAGVTKATVYYHFSSKEDLYAEVRIVLLQNSSAQARESVCRYTDPVAALVHLIDITIDMTLDRHRKYMFFHEIVAVQPQVSRRIGVAQRAYAMILEEAVASGQATGVFIEGRPRLIVAILLGSIARTANWYSEDGEVKPPQFSSLLRTMLIEGVLTPKGRRKFAALGESEGAAVESPQA